jgi:DNA primase catalytic core
MSGNSTYQQIIDQASIKDMLDYYGIQYDTRANKYFCPFHSDKHASLSVTNDDKWFECMAGSCNEKGNIHNLVEKMERLRGNEMDYLHRYDFIIKQQNLNIDFSLNDGKPKQLSPEQKKRNSQINMLKDAKDIAVNGLIGDKEKHGFASRYLASRGISEDTIKHFEIGYNEKGMIQDNLSDKYDNEELCQVGILGKSTVNDRYYDFQFDRILIPIKDKSGVVVGFGGRSLEENPSIKYKNTRETELFKKRDILFNYNNARFEASKNNEILVVEGYFDVVSAYEMGIKNCVALMGVAFSEEHKNLLQNIRSDNLTVTLCLDNDEAGRKAMCKIIPDLMASGYDVNVIDTSILNKGKDMNDFLCNGVTVEELNSAKMSAIEFIFKYTFNVFKGQRGKIDIGIVNKVYNSIFKNEQFNNSLNEELFIEYVSNNYGYSAESINNAIHPEKQSTLMSLAMQQVFCTIIKNKLINIANDTENRVLQQFLSQGRLTINHIMEGLNSPEYIKKNGASIAVPKYCEEYLLNTKEYKEFEAMFDKDFDRLLDNVYGMDKSGNMMPIRLNAKQKDIIQNQYLITFDNDIKQFFKEENDRFLKLFIADDLSEYERMLGDRYYFRADALEQYKSGKMCVINYGAMFDKSELDKLSRTNPNEFTTVNGDKFQNVLVFNNCAKELNLKPEQFVVKNNEQDIVRLDEDMPRNIPNSYNRQPPEQKAGRLPRMTETIRTHGMPPAD